MTEHEIELFQIAAIKAIKEEAHQALKETGKEWVEQTTKSTVESTVPLAIEATFIRLGLDCRNPFETQKDFAHLRVIRTDSEDNRKIVRQSVTKWITTMCLSAIGAGAAFLALIKPLLTQGPK